MVLGFCVGRLGLKDVMSACHPRKTSQVSFDREAMGGSGGFEIGEFEGR